MQLEQLRTELASIAHLGPVDGGELAGSGLVNSELGNIELGNIELGNIELGNIELDNIEITDVVHDSRVAAPGCLFCAVPGLTVDGHDFVAAAARTGASAALVERTVDAPLPQLRTRSVRRAMAYAAAAVHGHPSNELSVFGITGTNGKTTTTQLVSSVMASAGRACAVIGTLGGLHTTPESTELQRRLRGLVDDGIDVVALEVSSHALDQHRVDAVRFAVAAFSNLTPDHLDYHQDMDSYFEAKRRLFDGRAAAEVINVDDPWGERLAKERPNAIAVSITDVAITDESILGTSFEWRGLAASVPLPGRMNVANALMAAESCRLLGLSDTEIVAGLSSAAQVPGRMQTVPAPDTPAPTVVVDYSHTPNSIELALATLRAAAPQASISIVFGCGGDRDRQKRPLMGRAAELGADRVYLTSDNPRSEDPSVIIADALAGFEQPNEVIVQADRKRAIERAIIDSNPGDVILIAGKGHEKTQTIGADVLPFDDVSVAYDILQVTAP